MKGPPEFERARTCAGKIRRAMDTMPVVEPIDRINALIVALASEIVALRPNLSERLMATVRSQVDAASDIMSFEAIASEDEVMGRRS